VDEVKDALNRAAIRLRGCLAVMLHSIREASQQTWSLNVRCGSMSLIK
jgi:hypothetical protein